MCVYEHTNTAVCPLQACCNDFLTDRVCQLTFSSVCLSVLSGQDPNKITDWLIECRYSMQPPPDCCNTSTAHAVHDAKQHRAFSLQDFFSGSQPAADFLEESREEQTRVDLRKKNRKIACQESTANTPGHLWIPTDWLGDKIYDQQLYVFSACLEASRVSLRLCVCVIKCGFISCRPVAYI